MSAVTQTNTEAAVLLRPDDVPAAPPGHSTRHRLNGLDGYRALAVTVVALYHFKVPGFSGGWIGPELFFVLSGYLITTLLLDRSEPGRGRLSLTDFWLRRVRRLYPAVLLLVATLVAVVAVLAALRNTAVSTVVPSSLSSESLAALAYYANWHLIAEHVGYFGQSSSLLKHTWSLAIEEQFYVVFPLVFVLVRRSRVRWRAAGLTVVGLAAAASALDAAVNASGASINSVYYSTQTNAYHLLIGVVLAFASHGWTPGVQARKALTRLGAPAVAVIFFFVQVASDPAGMPRLWMMRGGGVLLDLAAAVLILSLVFGDHGSLVSRLFNLAPVVWVGAVSYGIYLWHYPVAVLLTPASTHLPRVTLVPVLVAVTLAASAFSYYFLEVVVRETLIPVRRVRWSVYATGFAGSMALVLFASSLIKPY